MAEDYTEEELKLKARARLRLKQKEASWTDVVKQAVPKGVSGAVDSIINTPENAINLGKMISGMNANQNEAMLGGTDTTSGMPDVEQPPNRTRDYLQEQGFIDPSLTQNMSPEQQVADTAIQGAVGGMFGGGSGVVGVAKNALVGGLSNAAGETVAQGTGSDALGLATSMLSPVGASKISALNKSRETAMALNALRDKTFQDAKDLGFVVVPEGRIADFAGRPKLLEAAIGINQRKTNDVARNSLGIPNNTPISNTVLDGIRKRVYDRAYEPLKKLGRVTTDNDYLDDLDRIEREYTGASGSFPEDVSPKLRELVDSYLVADFDTADVVDKIKVLRRRATKNINSEDPTNNEYGFAQQKIAEAMESQLERSVQAAGWPSTMLDNYREARKIIAISHTIGNALNSASGDVDINKLAKVFERGNYMDGDLLKVAKFGSINKPKVSSNEANKRTEFTHLAGAAGGFAAARAMDLPEWAGPLLAMGGWKTGEIVHGALSAPVREYLMSKTGQIRSGPDYSSLGIDSRMGPLSGMMFENAQGAQ